MSDSHSDALVFFGATGDLAHKKIFPSQQAMLKRGHLDVPVIGVAKSGWNLDQFRARARDSLEKHGGLDSAAFNKLCGLLRYVDGDYNDPATYQSSVGGRAGRPTDAHSNASFAGEVQTNSRLQRVCQLTRCSRREAARVFGLKARVFGGRLS